MTNVDKADVSRCLGCLGQISLCDSVAESNGGGVVDESEGVQAGNSSGVEESTSLDVGVVSWDSDNDVRNGLLELDSSDITELAEVSRDELGEGESCGFPKVVDLTVRHGTRVWGRGKRNRSVNSNSP